MHLKKAHFLKFITLNIIGSRILPMENGYVRPDTRTSHQTIRTENEGVIILLESRLFGLGDSW